MLQMINQPAMADSQKVHVEPDVQLLGGQAVWAVQQAQWWGGQAPQAPQEHMIILVTELQNSLWVKWDGKIDVLDGGVIKFVCELCV